MQTVKEPIRNPLNYIKSLDEKTFRRFVLLLYILLAGANIFTHEMWRDELHVWLTVRGSSSLAELFSNIKYQGHPPLWFLMLYAVSQVTRNPLWMQVLHFSIAVASTWVFLRFAPFSRAQRLLFVLGYFPVYEYAAISRNYGVGILLLFCFCAASGAARKNIPVLCIILFLLCMSNVYTFIITICLLSAIGFKAATDVETRAALIRRKWAILLCGAAVTGGLVVTGIMTYPKPDCFYATGWTTGFDTDRMDKTISTIWEGLVPIPQFIHNYWNSNIIDGQTTKSVLGIVILCFLLLSLSNNRTVFLFFSIAVGALLIFQYIVYIGFLRHFGHFFILVIVCIWLEKVWGRDKPIRGGLFSRFVEACAGGRQMLVFTLLGIHLGVGIFASIMEWRYPFSEGKHTAEYIKKNGLEKLPISGYMDFIASTVSGYLDRKIYYPNSDGFGTFVVFDNKRKTTMDTTEVLEKTRELANKNRSDVLLMLHYQLEDENDAVVTLTQFTESLQEDENYFLYLLKYKGQ